jgi:hypothetical protein
MESARCENRLLYESYLEAQLARWAADLLWLKAKDEDLAFEPARHGDPVEALQRKHDEASDHLSSLKGAGEEAWSDVQAGTRKGWLAFKSAFQGSIRKPMLAPTEAVEASGSPRFE